MHLPGTKFDETYPVFVVVEIEPYCILSLPYQSLADIVPCFHLVEKLLNHNFNVSLCVPIGECQELADPEGIEHVSHLYASSPEESSENLARYLSTWNT